jgi:hypothetical protein
MLLELSHHVCTTAPIGLPPQFGEVGKQFAGARSAMATSKPNFPHNFKDIVACVQQRTSVAAVLDIIHILCVKSMYYNESCA